MHPDNDAVRPVSDAPPAPLTDPVREIHILDRLATVFRHLRLIGAVFCVVVVLGAIQSFSTTPRYRAQATVLIQDERSVAVSLNPNAASYYEDPEPYFRTQFQILQGRALAMRVVKRLNLAERGIPSAEPGGPVAVIAAARAAVARAFRTVRAAEPPAGAPAAAIDKETAATAAFLGGITVFPITGTRLVEVTYDSVDPAFAATAVNTLAEEYVQQNLDLKLRDVEGTLEWLQQQLDKQKEKLEAAERAMSQYRSGQDALSLDSSQNIIVAQLTQLNDAVTRAKTTRLEKQAQFDQIRGLDGSSPDVDSFPAVAGNPTVQSLKARLTGLESERAKNAGVQGPQNPNMIRLSDEIASVRRELQAEKNKVLEGIRSDHRQAVANENGLIQALEEQKRRSVQLDSKSVNYTLLEREAQSERDIYQSLLQQEKSLRVVRNSRANNIQLMDRAEVPTSPYQPDHRRDLFMSIVLGLALGLGLAFGIEYLDDTIKTPDEVTGRLRLPLLGLVPAVRGGAMPLLREQTPHDFGEAFRSLRTSLVFANASSGARLIGVTSSQPLEGKTMTACNLAMVLAFGGARVLLIDADMRRPGVHRPMGVPNDNGLSHVLTGQSRIRDVVQTAGEPNLFIITAGHTPPNPSELLSSDRMRQLLEKLGQGPFDWIIIDTPPVLAVTDAVILAPYVTSFVFVIGAEMTRRAHVQRAVETLRGAQPASIAVVLNRVDFDRNKYYYSRYYGYHYKSYYGPTA